MSDAFYAKYSKDIFVRSCPELTRGYGDYLSANLSLSYYERTDTSALIL